MVIVAQNIPQWQSGQQNLNKGDTPSSGRPADVISQEIIARVKRLVLNDCRIKAVKLASEYGMPYGSVYTILHEHLGMSKASAMWPW